MLSRMMMCGANVLLLDQPTNHLDLESITAVQQRAASTSRASCCLPPTTTSSMQTVANRIMEILPLTAASWIERNVL